MARLVMNDQYHVAILVPDNLSRRQQARITRTLESFRFRLRVARAVRAVFREHPELAEVRLRFSL
jgi:hypothetical protein